MVTTPVTLLTAQLAATLVAVTFGWTPVADKESPSQGESPSQEVTQAGYEYEVRLSPTDLESLRNGGADSLSSALPKDLKGVERVRITVGEGPAPRLLTAADQAAAPQRELEPVRRTVAKPVVPDWPDAATLTAERRMTYQNPLQQGFEDGVRRTNEAGEWVRGQATDAGQRLRNSVEQTGDTLRNTTQDLLNGTGRALNELAPGATQRANPYADRFGTDSRSYASEAPGYDPNAQLPANTQQQDGYAGDQPPLVYDRRQSQPLREPSQPTSIRNNFDNPLSTDYDRRLNEQRSPEFDRTNNNGYSGDIVKSYTDEDNAYDNRSQLSRPLVDVPRRQTQPTQFVDRNTRTSDDDFFNNNRSVGRPEYEDPNQSRDSSNFPSLPNEQGFGDTRDNFARLPAREPDTRTTSGDPAARAWNGYDGANLSDTNNQSVAGDGQNSANQQLNDSSYFEKLLLVILGGVTCFTWIAYIDVRNKYRMALRGVPTAGFGHGVST